jgi:hypothetical protein
MFGVNRQVSLVSHRLLSLPMPSVGISTALRRNSVSHSAPFQTEPTTSALHPALLSVTGTPSQLWVSVSMPFGNATTSSNAGLPPLPVSPVETLQPQIGKYLLDHGRVFDTSESLPRERGPAHELSQCFGCSERSAWPTKCFGHWV